MRNVLVGSVILFFVTSLCSSSTVHAGCSTPSYRGATTLTVGSSPEAVAAGDFNRDGDPDLAVANQGTDNLSIFLGNGLGGFTTAPTLTAGDGPINVAAYDVNLDGILDLLVPNFVSDNVSVFLGNGNGTFSAATNFTVGNQPTTVAVGDFNFDGKPDLALDRLSGTSVPILMGNGTGTFSAPVTVSLSPNVGSFGISVAALNLDGKQDLLVTAANATNQGVIVTLIGNGAGGFSFGTTNAVTTQLIRDMAVADVNRDGRPDAITGNANTGGLSVLLGNGSSALGAATNFLNGDTVTTVRVGDVNNDGHPDLHVGRGTFTVLFGNGAGGFGSPVNFSGVSSNQNGMAIADFNLDGKLDWAVANGTAGNAVVRLNTCGGGTTKPPTDLTGDGKAEIALFRPSTGFWFVLRSDDFSFFSFPFPSYSLSPPLW